MQGELESAPMSDSLVSEYFVADPCGWPGCEVENLPQEGAVRLGLTVFPEADLLLEQMGSAWYTHPTADVIQDLIESKVCSFDQLIVRRRSACVID